MNVPTLSTQIYVLRLQNSKWYVGKTTDVYQRYSSHLSGEGSMWTSLHHPLRIEEVFVGDDFDEDKTTKKYMKEYGIDNVRGGSYVTMMLSFEQRKLLNNEINMASDWCLKCGNSGHFVKECPYNLPSKESLPQPVKRPVKSKCERCGWSSHTLDKCFAKTDSKSRTLLKRGLERVCDKCHVTIYHDSECWCQIPKPSTPPNPSSESSQVP